MCNMPFHSLGDLRHFKRHINVEVEDIDPASVTKLHQNLHQNDISEKWNSMKDALRASSQHGCLRPPETTTSSDYTRDPTLPWYRFSDRSIRLLNDNFLQWNLIDFCFRSQFPPDTHQASLDFVLLSYARHKPPLPLVSQTRTL